RGERGGMVLPHHPVCLPSPRFPSIVNGRRPVAPRTVCCGRGDVGRMSRLELGHLAADEWERLQGLVDRFEEACQGGRSVDLAACRARGGAGARRRAWKNHTKSTLKTRGRKQKRPRLEASLPRFPGRGPPASVPAALIYEEYRARQMYGDRYALDGYRFRF